MALSSKLITAFFADRPDRIQRFWSKVDTKGGARDQCWPWIGAVAGNGYGNVKIAGKNLQAHRVAFVMERGFLASDQKILHSCDFPRCCNPWHGTPGTHGENMQDAVKKGRHYSSRAPKLTDDQVMHVKELHDKLEVGTRHLADQFHVNQSTIRRALARCEAVA